MIKSEDITKNIALEYKKNLSKIEFSFENKILEFANIIRKNLIIPKCKKFGLSFYSSGYHYRFDDNGITIAHGVNGQNLIFKYDLNHIFDIVHFHIFDMEIGQFIKDVEVQKSWQAKKKLKKQ